MISSTFYATILFCSLTAPVCDVDHAVFIEQSKPVFHSMDACYKSAQVRTQEIADDPPEMLDENSYYKFHIDCEETVKGDNI